MEKYNLKQLVVDIDHKGAIIKKRMIHPTHDELKPYFVDNFDTKCHLVLNNFLKAVNTSTDIMAQYLICDETCYQFWGCKQDFGSTLLVIISNESSLKDVLLARRSNVVTFNSCVDTIFQGELNQLSYSESQLEDALKEAEATIRKIQLELMEKEEELKQIAILDPLTHSYNRLYLKTKFQELCMLQKRLDHDITIVMINLNDLKIVNELYGHDEGDRLLATFSQTTQQIIRQDFDFLFRISGDEFLLLMVDCPIEQALDVCKRLNTAFLKHTLVSSLFYGAVALNVDDSVVLEDYLSAADDALYLFKKSFKAKHMEGDVN